MSLKLTGNTEPASFAAPSSTHKTNGQKNSAIRNWALMRRIPVFQSRPSMVTAKSGYIGRAGGVKRVCDAKLMRRFRERRARICSASTVTTRWFQKAFTCSPVLPDFERNRS
jgi:hypothetical protein